MAELEKNTDEWRKTTRLLNIQREGRLLARDLLETYSYNAQFDVIESSFAHRFLKETAEIPTQSHLPTQFRDIDSLEHKDEPSEVSHK